MPGKTVEFEGKAIKATDDALLVEIDGKDVWFPRSQIVRESEVQEEGDEGTLVVTEWIAIEKGLV